MERRGLGERGALARRALADRDALGRRSLGSPALFAIVYTTVAAGIYFALGVIADHALGLTPVVFLVSALFFVMAAMTYVEGASLHQDRAGSTVFARFAFNELVSFVAGWALILDFLILIAIAAVAATDYASVFWDELAGGPVELVAALGIVAYVAVRHVLGHSPTRARRIALLVVADLVLQVVVIVLGLFIVFDGSLLVEQIDLGSAPSWDELLFALTLTTVAFTSLESASGLSGEVRVGRAGLRRLVGSVTATVVVIYVGIALVAVTALPVLDGQTALGGEFVEKPVLGIVRAFDPPWLVDVLRWAVGILGTMTLVAAAQSGMFGLSRLAYSLGTNRQIPSAVGRLHPTRSTPFVVIVIAAVLAGGLTLTRDVELLAGIYAFGALIAFSIAHLAIVVLRYREPDRPRPYRMPFNVRFRGGDLPLPALVGAITSIGAFGLVVVFHEGARYVGMGWMVFGLALYLIYRTTQDKSVLRRVIVPEEALRREAHEVAYGSILVPITGTPLDDDIVQTAGRLAAEELPDPAMDEGPTIEAIWVHEVPMSLPLDARLPDEQLRRARQALARAKEVGEEYEGVAVATATVRARRAGQAIVEEARRRGVEAIVLAAEEPTRIRGGAVMGGIGGTRDLFLGAVTRYVVDKAPCRVILTAPPSGARPVSAATGDGPDGGAPADRAERTR